MIWGEGITLVKHLGTLADGSYQQGQLLAEGLGGTKMLSEEHSMKISVENTVIAFEPKTS